MPIWSMMVEKEGVVSLLDMFEFAAREYLDLAHRIGLFLGASCNQKIEPHVLTDAFPKLIEEANKLGLVATREHLGVFILEVIKQDPSKATLTPDGVLRVSDTLFATPRLCHHLEAIYTSLRAELGSILFRGIPRERNQFYSPEWLRESAISVKFPTSLVELRRAGVCYALGQSTASVFHSMRALEPGLFALAGEFEISATHDNWQVIIDQIEAAAKKLGAQPKSQKKIDDEKFFGSAASHLYFVKNAWRNHVAHTRDSHSDDDALKIMRDTVQFIESLCGRLGEPISG